MQGRRFSAWAVVIGAATVATAPSARAAGPDAPRHDPGIYVAAQNAGGQEELTRLHSGHTQNMQTHGVGKSMLTQGITKPTMSIDLSGKSAEVRTSTTPVFYFYVDTRPPSSDPSAGFAQMMGGDSMPMGVKDPNDFALVPTSVTEDGRHIDLGKMGSKKPKDAVDMVVERLEPGAFRLKPKKPLLPGEYAFVFAGGMANQAWEVGVDK